MSVRADVRVVMASACLAGACVLDPDAVVDQARGGDSSTTVGGGSGTAVTVGTAGTAGTSTGPATGDSGPGVTGDGSTADGSVSGPGSTGSNGSTGNVSGGTGEQTGSGTAGSGCSPDDPDCNPACPDDPCIYMCPLFPPPNPDPGADPCMRYCDVCITDCVANQDCDWDCALWPCTPICVPSPTCTLPPECASGCVLYDCSLFPYGYGPC